MNKRQLSVSAVACVVFVAVLITFFATYIPLRGYYDYKLDQVNNAKDGELDTRFAKLLEADKYIRKNFIGTIDEAKMMDYILAGYMESLNDPYSIYHDYYSMQEQSKASEGKAVGIGVRIMPDFENGGVKILKVMKNSPAEAADLNIGDFIVKINGTTVNEVNYYETISSVAGEPGTMVDFLIKRGDTEFELSIKRDEYDSETVFYTLLENKVAYIEIYDFSGNVAVDFINYMEESKKDNAVGYIFDVRNNPGGDLGLICEILDYLLPEGPIVKIIAADGSVANQYDSTNESFVDLPMVVLANENTASAGELFTAALKDYNLSKTVGVTTFGKGVMQNIITLSDGSGLRLTTHKYNPPFSENYDGIGIAPDIEVAMDTSLIYVKDSDTQYMKAIEIINGLIG